MIYKDLYQNWEMQSNPSATTARMVRTTLKYVAGAVAIDDWALLRVMPEQQALVLLDGAMSNKTLRSQSRSNYRNYLHGCTALRVNRVPILERTVMAGSGPPLRAGMASLDAIR